MKIVNMHDAKTHLSQLLAAAEEGEDVVIARQGMPVARLVVVKPSREPQPGAWQSMPGWQNYRFDPAVLAPIETDEALREAGWPS